MNLPAATRFVVAAFAATGLFTLAVAVRGADLMAAPRPSTVLFAAVLCTMIAASWVWPLMMFIGDQSDAIGLDEGCLVALVLIVPATVTVLTFTVATVGAQLIKRRPLVKSVFNLGQELTAVGAALLVFGLADHAERSIGYTRVGAALAAALVYYVVNTNAVGLLLATLGTPWRQTVFSGYSSKAVVALGSISIAIPAAMLFSRDPALLPLAVLPFVILRYLGAGLFDARHDRARLRGLFESTLAITRAVGDDETRAEVVHAVGSLLRSPDASLTPDPPTDGSLAAPVELGDRRLWLAVAGRSRTEPFDGADRGFLDALASVGAVALTNADLYEEVEQHREKLALITNSLGEGVVAVDGDGAITFMNPAGCDMLGWGRPDYMEGAIGANWSDSTPRFLMQPARRAMDTGCIFSSDDTRFRRRDGSYFPVTVTASPIVDGTDRSGAVIIFRDISERKKFEEELARHAFQDPLTGLANRRLLLDHLDQALLRAGRAGEQVAVLFCDVDRFKVVNDNLGHQAGDEFLRLIADRLRNLVHPGDTLSRFGGDEFIILLEGVTSVDGPSRVAQSILDALREPVLLSDGREVVANLTIGIALSSEGQSRDDVLHHADVAMYRAKDRGRGGQFVVFDVEEMGVRSTEQVDLETALHHALVRHEIEVYYQPLISLADRKVTGAEALVRWQHPRHGLLLPTQFIELAEDSGLILSIGRAVLEQACRQARIWYETFHVAMEIGVNLSARQFQQVGLAEEIEQVLQTTGIDPAQLCLEITESLAMKDVELTSTILCKLHTLGVRVAIDDFGTGHSSLGYMARFPIDVVKIDQSFVRDIERDPVKSAIVSAVVALSRAIDSTIVVEGVETAAQLDHVRGLGCQVAQGFYFAPPMTASAFGQLLASQRPIRPNLRIVGGDALAG
jgi:diguanylate cyclase (GGDEF)-like protein/PAS domain S-box-containing protein